MLAETPGKKLTVDLDRAKRLLEVMARRKRKLLEILIRSFELGLHGFLLVDIRAGAEPFHDAPARIPHRKGATDKPSPAVLLPVPQAVLKIVRRAGPDCRRPGVARFLQIFGMQGRFPTFIPELITAQAREFVPAFVVVIDIAIGSGRPYQRGHR